MDRWSIEEPVRLDVDKWAVELADQMLDFEEMHRDIASAQAVGDVDNGLVRASVCSPGRVTEIYIDREALCNPDPDELSGLLLEAINRAFDKLDADIAVKSAKILASTWGSDC